MTDQTGTSTNAVAATPATDPLDPQYWAVVCRNVGGVKVWMSEDQDGEGKLTGASQKDAKRLLAEYRVKYASDRMARGVVVPETVADVAEGASIEVTANDAPATATATQDGDQTSTPATSTSDQTATPATSTNDAPSLLENIQNAISAPATATPATSTPARSNAATVPTAEQVAQAKTERAALRAKGFDGAYGSSGALSAENARVRELNNLVRNGTRKPSTGTTTTRAATSTPATSTSKGRHAVKHDDTALYALRMLEREIKTLTLDWSSNAGTISVLDQYRAVLADRVAANTASTPYHAFPETVMVAETVQYETVATYDQYGDLDDLIVVAYPAATYTTHAKKIETVAIKVSQEVAEIVAELTPDVLAQFRAFQAMLAANKHASTPATSAQATA